MEVTRMGFMNITVVIPNPNGTIINEVDQSGKVIRALGVSLQWSTRFRPTADRGGCPSWIDQIAVAPDLASAGNSSIHLPSTIPSSSLSSRDVVAITLNDSGVESGRKTYAYVYVAKRHNSTYTDPVTGKLIPIADEIWFAQGAVDNPIVFEAEGECNHTL
jgi:hypothetical protein